MFKQLTALTLATLLSVQSFAVGSQSSQIIGSVFAQIQDGEKDQGVKTLAEAIVNGTVTKEDLRQALESNLSPKGYQQAMIALESGDESSLYKAIAQDSGAHFKGSSGFCTADAPITYGLMLVAALAAGYAAVTYIGGGVPNDSDRNRISDLEKQLAQRESELTQLKNAGFTTDDSLVREKVWQVNNTKGDLNSAKDYLATAEKNEKSAKTALVVAGITGGLAMVTVLVCKK